MNFPKGMEIAENHLTTFKNIAKESGLKSAGAQKVADLFVTMQQEAATRHVEMVTQWAEEARNDSEIGGAKFEANLGLARKVLARLGGSELPHLLTMTGLGNHKSVIGFLAKIGASISEDRLPGGASGATGEGAAADRETQQKAFFDKSPQMFEKKG